MRVIADRRVFSVGEFNRAIAQRIRAGGSGWVEGDISDLSLRGSKMVYFTLHDEAAQVDVIMTREAWDRSAVDASNGDRVQVLGRADVFEARARLQLRAERVEAGGEGLLLRRIEELRARLGAEGLLDEARKVPLPFLPRRIGLITGADTAAKGDVLNNLFARWPGASVVVVHSQMQGFASAGQVIDALRYLDSRDDVEVIVIARGGGSLEDLMSFNDEALARTIAATATAVVSAVGHDRDWTICDYVADRRVSTPTKAAEAIVPDVMALADRLDRGEAAMRRCLGRRLDGARRELDRADRVLAQPAARVAAAHRGVDAAEARVKAAMSGRLGAVRSDLARAERVVARQPLAIVAAARERLFAGERRAVMAAGGRVRGALARVEFGAGRFGAAGVGAVRRSQDRVAVAAAGLGALSPLRTLERGYAVVRRGADGTVVADASALATGDDVMLQLRDGEAGAVVTVAAERPVAATEGTAA